MTLPGKDPSNFVFTGSDENTFKPELDLWRQVIRGGEITCDTPGRAINLRYRMYRIRKKLQSAEKSGTPYDDLIIQLKPGDTKLVVTMRRDLAAAGVINVVPYEVPDETFIDPSEDPRNSAEAIAERMKDRLKPREPLI